MAILEEKNPTNKHLRRLRWNKFHASFSKSVMLRIYDHIIIIYITVELYFWIMHLERLHVVMDMSLVKLRYVQYALTLVWWYGTPT